MEVAYTWVLHDGRNQSNCHTLKNKRRNVKWPPTYRDAKDVEGWLAWDSYHICTQTTGTVPALPLSARSGASLSAADPAHHRGPCTWVPIAGLLCVKWHHHLLETQSTAPFQGLIWGCARKFPGGTTEEPKVREKPVAHREETLQRKQKVHCVFCMSTSLYLSLLPMQQS